MNQLIVIKNDDHINGDNNVQAYKKLGTPATEEQVSNMIGEADSDRDGKVSKYEFTKFMNREFYPAPKSDVVKAFVTIAENDVPGKDWPKAPGMIHVDKLKYVMHAFVDGFSYNEIDQMIRHAGVHTKGSMIDYKAFAEVFFRPNERF